MSASFALPLSASVTVNPITLAELLLMTPLRRRANLIVLSPHPDGYVIFAKRGSSTLATFNVDGDVGNATVARLARMADLDPFATPPGGVAKAARLRVRAGKETGEILVTVEATPHGLEAELRPIAVNGQSLEQPQHGQLKRCVRCASFQSPLRQRCELDGGDLIDVADEPRPGGTIGVYRVGRVLGDGGMGTVYAGQHALIGRAVAIKVPHFSISSDPPLVRRFLAEARAAARLHHPNVIDVTDYGLMSDGRPFMVMEQLAGEALRDRLDRDKSLTPPVALLVAREVALGLCAAHEGGVVHRDLKPDNILLLQTSRDDAPRLKIVDFGAASLSGEKDGDDLLLGTPWYMAPEHSRGEATDGRADIYALGIVLFEMLTGDVPFDGDNEEDVRLAHMTRPMPAAVAPEPLPEAVTRTITRATRKRADERYQSAAEMLADIDRALAVVTRRDWRKWLPI